MLLLCNEGQHNLGQLVRQVGVWARGVGEGCGSARVSVGGRSKVDVRVLSKDARIGRAVQGVGGRVQWQLLRGWACGLSVWVKGVGGRAHARWGAPAMGMCRMPFG